MARKCGGSSYKGGGSCGMSQGIYNPFFQNGAYWYGQGASEPPFDPDQYFDLLNLQSTNPARFTLVSSTHISAWTEENGTTQWTQGTDANRPFLTGGIPIFDGSNDQLIRASDISASTYSLYIVFKNLGALNKILFGAGAVGEYLIHNTAYKLQLIGPAGQSSLINAGIGGKRPVVLAIRRNNSTLSVKINDRDCFLNNNSFTTAPTLISRLMSFNAGGFFMNGELYCFGMSSSYQSDSINQQIINALYSRYSLSSKTSTDVIIGFGDSNTVGQLVTPYLVGLASSMSLGYLNLGISGTPFVNTTAAANNGYDRFQSQIITKPFTDWVVIQYGTNDINGAISASVYGTQYNDMIGRMIAAGISAQKIVICTPPYRLAGDNATALDDYRSQLVTIKNTHGTKYFDLLQDMRDNGGDSLLSDTVHLNAAGQTRWQNGVFTAFTS